MGLGRVGSVIGRHPSDGRSAVERAYAGAGTGGGLSGKVVLVLVLSVWALHVCLRCVRLWDLQISGCYDEGVHLALGQMLAAHPSSKLYTDLVFTHPPLLPEMLGYLTRLFGSNITAIRLTYVLATSASVPLLYLTASRLMPRMGAVFCCALYAVSPTLTTLYGPRVYVEPCGAALCILAFFLAVYPSRLRGLGYLAAGVCVGLAVGFKLPFVLMVLPVAALAAWPADSRGPRLTNALLVGVGALAGAYPVIHLVLTSRDFVEAAIRWPASHPYWKVQRLRELMAWLRMGDPMIWLGMAGGAVAIWRRKGPLSWLGWALVAVLGLLCVAGKSFYWRYLIEVDPMLAVLGGFVCYDVVSRLRSPDARAAVATIALVAAVAIVTNADYYLVDSRKDPLTRDRVAAISQVRGYVLTNYPTYVVEAGRRVLPWKYGADWFPGLGMHALGVRELCRQADRSDAVFLVDFRFPDAPSATEQFLRHVSTRFRLAYEDAGAALYVRRR